MCKPGRAGSREHRLQADGDLQLLAIMVSGRQLLLASSLCACVCGCAQVRDQPLVSILAREKHRGYALHAARSWGSCQSRLMIMSEFQQCN